MTSVQVSVAVIVFILCPQPMMAERNISDCGQLRLDHISLITNASDTHIWPWHVAIFHQVHSPVREYVCGGTLFAADMVLTAGHCVVSRTGKRLENEQISVSMGRVNLSANETSAQWSEVSKIILHPEFFLFDNSNDIAILKISPNVVFNKFVQPICLWDSSSINLSDVVGRHGTVVGWGQTELGVSSEILREASMPVKSSMECLMSSRSFAASYLSDKTFCAGIRNGTSVCLGDSGGSMTFEKNDIYYIRGIVSVSPAKFDYSSQVRTCDPMQYVIFTDVAQYLPWIKNQFDTKVRCTYAFHQNCFIFLPAGWHQSKSQVVIFDDIPSSDVKVMYVDGGNGTMMPDISDAFIKFEKLDRIILKHFKFRNVTRAHLTTLSGRISWLDVISNEITELYSDAFLDLMNLKEVNLFSNKLNALPENLFQTLLKLEVLSLSFNQLEALPANIFKNNQNLLLINLSQNELKAIHVDTFKELGNLFFVSLKGNQLETLPANTFKNNKKLTRIDVSENRLKEIHVDTFKGLHNFEYLYLSNNSIEILPRGLFDSNSNLKFVYLEHNKINRIECTFSHLLVLKKVDLTGNVCINLIFEQLMFYHPSDIDDEFRRKCAN